MKIRASHGLRYNGNAGHAATRAAPPHDPISGLVWADYAEPEH